MGTNKLMKTRDSSLWKHVTAAYENNVAAYQGVSTQFMEWHHEHELRVCPLARKYKPTNLSHISTTIVWRTRCYETERGNKRDGGTALGSATHFYSICEKNGNKYAYPVTKFLEQ